LAAMSCWGLIFSVVTICGLGVAFDYDDTLVNSVEAYRKAFAAAPQAYSPQFWSVVNQSYDIEKPKVIPYGLAWVFRAFGFKVSVITSRPQIDADGLRKEWRHLVPRARFLFASDKTAKHQYLNSDSVHYVLFFGDSDSDMEEARKAHVFPIRVRRSKKSVFKEDYNPGSLGEVVIPLSEY
jgi:acid phosphatase class B